MARARVIRPSVLNCPVIEEVGYLGNYFWIGLLLQVDDYGRTHFDITRLKKAVFPYVSRGCRDSVVYKWVQTFARHGMVHLYESSDGRPCIQIANWHKYQKVSHPTRSLVQPMNSGKPPESFRSGSGAFRDEGEGRGEERREVDIQVLGSNTLPSSDRDSGKRPVASDPTRGQNVPPPTPVSIPTRPGPESRGIRERRQLADQASGGGCPPELLEAIPDPPLVPEDGRADS